MRVLVLRVHVPVVLSFLLRMAAALGPKSVLFGGAHAEEHGYSGGENPRSLGQHSV
jgi:hypothetical protein